MPSYQEFRDSALSNGYTLDEANKFIADKRSAAISQGYSEQEVDKYLGIPNSDQKIKAQFETAMLRAQRKEPEKVMSFTDSVEAGYQVSTAGLAARGTMPSKVMSEDAPWYNRIASQAATLVGDVPAMVAGAMIGGVGGAETGPGAAAFAMGGAFALPAGLRAVMMDAYDKGEFHTPTEFLERAGGIMVDTAKGYVTGAVTGGVGKVVEGTVATAAGAKVLGGTMAPTTARVTTDVAKLGAELGSMVTVSRGLEGELPHAQDFIDGAILLGGGKFAVSGAAKLRGVYSATGKRPDQVMSDAQKNPSIVGDLASDLEIPRAYEAMAESGGMPGEVMAGKARSVELAEPKPLSPDALSTKDVLTNAIKENLGKDGEALLEVGGVRVVQSVSELPNRLDKQPHNEKAAGYTDENGNAWIVADNTRPMEIVDKLLHEVGTHIGMEKFVGANTFQKMLDHVELKVSEGDPIFVEARRFAEQSAEGRQELLPEETLAYVVERSPDLPVTREIMAKVRAWIYKSTGGRFIDLTDADIRQIAVSALRKQAREFQSVAGEAKYSLVQDEAKTLTAYHRTIADFPLSEGFKKERNKLGVSFAGAEGFYFSLDANEPTAKIFGKRVIAADLDLKNPVQAEVVLDGRVQRVKLEINEEEFNKFYDGDSRRGGFIEGTDNIYRLIDPEKLYSGDVAFLKSRGYDSIIVNKKEGVTMPSQVVVFDATQAKNLRDIVEQKVGYSLRTPEEETVLRRIDQNGRPRRSVTFDDFYRRFVDDLAPIEDISKDAAKLFRLTRGSYGVASHFLEFGTIDGKTLAKNGEGLKSILGDFKNDLDGFRAYAVSKRALELEGRGLNSGIPAAEAASIVAAGAKYEPTFRKLVDYQDRLIQFLKDSGVISDATHTAMKAANKEYVPFYRIFEGEMGMRSAGGGVATRNPIKGIKGSDRAIADPIESIIKNTYLYVTLAMRNEAGLAFVDAPEAVGLLNKVKTKMRPIEVSEKEMQTFFKQHGLNPADAEAFNIFRPLKQPLGANEIAVFRDGKREIYEVPEDVATAIKASDSTSMGMVMKILSFPASTLRAGAVLSPDFMLRNISRDQMSAFLFSNNNYVPFMDAARGALSIATKDEHYQNWLKSGGANAAMVAIDRNYIQQHVFKLNEQTGFMDATWNVVKSPIEMLRVASELFENATRVGEFKKAVGGATDKASIQEAGYQSREITLDFARSGAQGKAINMIAAFFNAQVQGLDRTVRAFQDNPYRTTAKTVAAITLPSVLLWMANHDDPRYKDVPQWQKDMFWLVMTKDTIYRIPKPFEIGLLFGSLPERALDYAKDQDPEMAMRFLKTVAGGFIPNLIPTAAQPVAEQWANKSFFTGSPIVSADKEKLIPELRYNDYTSELTKAIGHTIGQMPRVRDMSIASPAVIDTYIRGWSGGLGNYAMQLADKALRSSGVLPDPVKPEATLSDIPAIKAFIVRYPSATTQPIIDFHEKYDVQKKVFASVQRLAEEGNPDAAIALMESRPDAMMKLDGISQSMTNINKFIHTINQMDVAPKDKNNKEARDALAKEKRQLIDTAYLQMNEMAKMGNALLKETSNIQFGSPVGVNQ